MTISKLQEQGVLTPKTKKGAAITPDGKRTITGVLAPGDEELIHEAYPVMSKEDLHTYLGFFKAPRLYEVMGPLELVHRMLNKEYSTIQTPTVTVSINTAYNPLSILTKVGEKIIRIKTKQSELLHEGMEKLNLRELSMQKVNRFFDELFGIQIRFACSCGIGAIYTTDSHSSDFITFLEDREEMGRTFDSDVLSVTGDLYYAENAADIPKEVLDGAPDVSSLEIASYTRYYNNVESIINSNPYTMDFLTEKQVMFFPS